MKKFYLKNYKNNLIVYNNNLNYLINNLLNLYKKKSFFYIYNPKFYKNKMCIETGNRRSVYRDFSLSRMNIKDSLSKKYINGLKKVS